MSKIFSPPSNSNASDLADFIEYTCWKNKSVSDQEIIRSLGLCGEDEVDFGCSDLDDKNSELVEAAMNEIERRSIACSGGYPFKFQEERTALHYNYESRANQGSLAYRYLLLSTMLNMKNEKKHDGIDGTQILEKLSAQILKNYLGSTNARSFVFGTGVGGGFEAKVNELCQLLGEGGSGFRNLDDGPVNANDDKLDVVGWIPFSDDRPGKLIIFGQCKTGTSWGNLITQLQPTNFIKNWIDKAFCVDPLRALFLSENVSKSQWSKTVTNAGLLLDRCRLVEFCFGLDSKLEDELKRWVSAAQKYVEIKD